ncbi:MAG TPA: MATE family efflux transporter [Steroidobacteraceae bacterium]|jgi:putative MATE family efflux protein|nr:MATE family efflux transporter [Steroidobacteraceae bacterium]
MRDLTQGFIPRQIVAMAVPIFAGMLLQTLYYIVDLYFVSRIGNAAIAGVSAAGNIMLIVFALTQMLGVGIVALMSQAVGRKDPEGANLIFNQSLVLSLLCALLILVTGYAGTTAYMEKLGANAATVMAGRTYLYWFLPGLGLQFALVAMGSALRATGIVQPTMIVQGLTVMLNIVLAPVLIAGWGSGHPLGVAGAGLASTIAVAFGVLLLAMYFFKLEKYVQLHPSMWAPRLTIWLRMLNIGLPAGGEFALMFAYLAVIFWIIRDFGATAQAGFGIGSRVMQSIFLPAMAVAFATAPIVGQNFGARRPDRVRATFRSAALMTFCVMLLLTLLCQSRSDWLIQPFSSEPQVVAVGTEFLSIISLNFVASGIIFTASSTFQGLGNTWPSLASSASRLVTFVGPAIWLSRQPWFQMHHLWYLSVATVSVQALFSLFLVRREFLRRLGFPVLQAA